MKSCPHCGHDIDSPPPSKSNDNGQAEFWPNSGRKLGHEGAQRAADHAGAQWQAEAWLAFCTYVVGHKQFTMEAVRLASPQVPSPPDNRAWGVIALRAKRAGMIRRVRFVEAQNPNCHAANIVLWERI